MIKTTMTMTGTRNGKTITMTVEHQTRDGMVWVRGEGGKPLFGTTGYYRNGQLFTYRSKLMVDSVVFS